jgi:hypothetical protein
MASLTKMNMKQQNNSQHCIYSLFRIQDIVYDPYGLAIPFDTLLLPIYIYIYIYAITYIYIYIYIYAFSINLTPFIIGG